MIPAHEKNGFLPSGVHTCTGREFIARFVDAGHRSTFRNPVENIISYAASVRARSILVGGSFITNKSKPYDLDCVVLFPTESQIPAVRDGLDVDSTRIDVFFASQDNDKIVGSFLRLFSNSQFGEPVGVVEILIGDDSQSFWDINWEPDDDTFEIVKRVYLNRFYTNTIKRNRVLVTVHGIRSHSEWDAEVTLIASANGWIVAPFRYGFTNLTIFTSKTKREEIIDRFRMFLSDVHTLTDVNSVSVIAHSFGTYIAASYVLGFDSPPTSFDTLVLTGSILNEELDFQSLTGRVGYVINEVAPNDEWAEWAAVANFKTDPLFGKSATQGFKYSGERLIEYKSSIFTHNNVIRRDVMVQRWLPAMEANLGSAYRDANHALIRRYTK